MKYPKVAALFFLALDACALLSKGEVPTRRYFSPDFPVVHPAAVMTSSSELRLGRVTAGAFIAERIMFRQSAHEVGLYDDRIWTEKPESYLRRGLTQVLFEERGLRSVMRGAGPTLDVELITFEEVISPEHVGRVKVAFSLSDERIVSLQQTLSIERPVAASTAENEAYAVAQAMGEALRDAIDEVSRLVVADLAKGAPAIAGCPVVAAP